MSPADFIPELSESLKGLSAASNFPDLRSVRWRVNLGVLPSSPSSSIEDHRRVTADSRRRYALLRKHLLIDPHVRKFGNDNQDLVRDNPLSQSPDSIWGRFFLNAELEQTVDKDLSRLYPEHGNYFQTPGCQVLLRRILLLWCLRHPECGYRQGMHELLAPLLYVLHADIQHLYEIRKLYEDHFVDKFDESLFHDGRDLNFKISLSPEDDAGFEEKSRKHIDPSDLDTSVQNTALLSDPYGAEGELGIVISERFMEHDAYCMFDALMSGAGGAVAMASFFSHSPSSATQTGLAPAIEASLALYHLLSIVDSSLYSHLVELAVEPQYFALRWLRVLFGREFSLENLLVIWDEIFSFDNSRSVKAAEHDPGILNSRRGAFISGMAVSMMLHVRSSLLATEYATSCLQRLLNFPEKVDLEKLIAKAKCLVPLAMEANVPSYSSPLIERNGCNKHISTKSHGRSPSFDSSSPQTPGGCIPERYWEEKWRVIQEEEEIRKKSSPSQASSKRKGWTEKIRMRLSRSESEPCPSKRESRERSHKSSVRRSLLEDLARQLNGDEDAEKIVSDKLSNHKDSLCMESDVEVREEVEERMSNIDKICSARSITVEEHSQDMERMSYIEKICSARRTDSEEHSPAFSDPPSSTENDIENSSTESNTSQDIADGEMENSCSFESAINEPSFQIHGVSVVDDISREFSTDTNSNGVSGIDDVPREPLRTVSKEWKGLSTKFQWLFKFGRHNSGEGTSDKRKVQIEDAKLADGGSHEGNKEGLSADEANCNPLNVKLRNLGLSMLDNIQVLEAAILQESPMDQLSKHALIEKGQVTAMAALTELRKISNLLREM